MTDPLDGPSTVSSTIASAGKGVRTKLGCFTCRARKVKCDLDRPACQTCVRLNLECTYVKPEGQMNIPRLRRGRKRRRSDPQQSSGSSVSVSASVPASASASASASFSWAERFMSEELQQGGSNLGHGGGSRSYEIQQQQQQSRRASTNTMPDLWRFQNPYDDHHHNLTGVAGAGNDMGLASSLYLNSLMGRRESLPVIFPRHLAQRYGHGQGQGQEGRGMPSILDPSMRTASPLMYPTYPSSFDYENIRPEGSGGSTEGSSGISAHLWDGPGSSSGSTIPELSTGNNTNAYHTSMPLPVPLQYPHILPSNSHSHTASPLSWQNQTPQIGLDGLDPSSSNGNGNNTPRMDRNSTPNPAHQLRPSSSSYLVHPSWTAATAAIANQNPNGTGGNGLIPSLSDDLGRPVSPFVAQLPPPTTTTAFPNHSQIQSHTTSSPTLPKTHTNTGQTSFANNDSGW